MMLTEHFHLDEFTTSQTASRQNLNNEPPRQVVENLKKLAFTLESVRTLLGYPLHINSGYRSPALNAAIGGVKNSAHLLGYAADFICPQYGSPLSICHFIANSKLIQFDQLIEEGTWVHISVDPRFRGQILTKKPGGGYSVGLRPSHP